MLGLLITFVVVLSITSRYADSFKIYHPKASSSSLLSTLSTSITDTSSSSNKELNVIERVSRAISFYTSAIPVFLSYQLLDAKISFRREQLNEEISKEDEEKEFDLLHEWGSEIITEKIKELKGFYVKTGFIITHTLCNNTHTLYNSFLFIFLSSPTPTNRSDN